MSTEKRRVVMKRNRKIRNNFPQKLYRMLEYADKSPDDVQAIISWQPHGRSFKIKDKKRLQDEVLPLFFSSGQYDTFRRNLNHWGFRLINGTNNPDFKSYYHKIFLRTRRDLCSNIKRVHELSSSDISSSPTPSYKIPFFSEPNFHEMEWLPSSKQESCTSQEQVNTDDIRSTANVRNFTQLLHQSSIKSIISNNSSHSSADHVSTSLTDIPSIEENHSLKEAAELKTSLDETIHKLNGFREQQSVENVIPLHFASSAQCCTNNVQKVDDSSAALEYIQQVLKLNNNMPFIDHKSQTCLSSPSQENRPNRPNTTSRNCIQEIGEDLNIVQNLPPSLAIHSTHAGNKSSDINQVLTSTNEVITSLPSLGTKRKRTSFDTKYKEEAMMHDLGDDFWDERGWGTFLLEQYFLLPRDLPKLCLAFETT